MKAQKKANYCGSPKINLVKFIVGYIYAKQNKANLLWITRLGVTHNKLVLFCFT